MIPDKLKQLIQLLTEKTKTKKAIWNKSSGNKQFKLSLDNGIAITVEAWEDNFENADYNVKVFNKNGDVIENYTSSGDASSEEFVILRNFHKAANDSYYRVEETMDALLTSVSSQDVIGTEDSQKKSSAPDDDDLPF